MKMFSKTIVLTTSESREMLLAVLVKCLKNLSEQVHF